MATRTRIFFDDLGSAAEGLITLLEYARNNREQQFRFGPLKAEPILKSGLWIEGHVDGVAATITNKIPGAVEHSEG